MVAESEMRKGGNFFLHTKASLVYYVSWAPTISTGKLTNRKLEGDPGLKLCSVLRQCHLSRAYGSLNTLMVGEIQSKMLQPPLMKTSETLR